MELGYALEHRIDCRVGEVVHEKPFPVMAVDAIRRIGDPLLFEERVFAQSVFDKFWHRSERTKVPGVLARARVAGRDAELRYSEVVGREFCLTTQLVRRSADDVAVASKRVADASSAISQHAAHDALQGVQSELQVRHYAKVPASTPKTPKQLRVLIWTGMYDSSVGRDDLSADQLIARQSVLCRQMPNAATQSEPADTSRDDDTARRHESRRLCRCVEIEPRGAALRSGEARTAVYVYPAHHRQIDDQASFADTVA